MFMDLDAARRLRSYAEQRTGVLIFECKTLGSFDGIDEVLSHIIEPKIRQRAAQEHQAKPGLLSQVCTAIGGDWGESVGNAHTSRLAKSYWDNVYRLIARGQFQRAVADLDDKETALLAAASAQAIAMGSEQDKHDELMRFLYGINAALVWAGGRSQFVHNEIARELPAEAAASADAARELMQHFINADDADYRQTVGNYLGQYVQVSQSGGFHAAYPQGAAAIASALGQGATAWATASDLESEATPFKPFEAGSDLFLGMLPTADGVLPVGFAGNESLVTVAQPGAGKTQCHILPNLMTYDGPLVVLDPKLELLELTAGHRQSEGKRIIVLNLADDDVPTHKFNVMDFVDRRPEFMWNALVELAEFLLPAAPNDSNPIFRNKAAEFFAVCLGGEMLESIGAERHPTLSRAIKRVFAAPESAKNWLYDTEQRAADFGCEPLEQSAVSFAALINNADTIDDFLRFQSNATSVLSKYRGGIIDRVANGAGDWCPEDLRTPGCTLYIRIPYEEMAVYGGFVRMVLYTIIKRLRKGGTEQSGLPLTFLLDEVAQLGNLDQIANVIETGRGYGLRVWMILQDYDQAKAGSSKPNLILKTPKVRLFMNPTLETAQDMSAELGKINQVITGKDKPLAEPSELMGQDYKNTIVALSSGSRPLSLRKHFAWQDPDYEAITSQPYHLSAQTQPSNPLSPSDIQDLEITNKMRL